ncbi:MAG TPA: RNA polymerase sigma factor [Bacteroidetes bacterium]|nr:RNA polymerase sigma factor [Bacteroidota bacterium]
MNVSEYNQCVEQFADPVYRFVVGSLRDEDRARDIVQDTFEKLWVRAENVSFEKARSYIFSTAYHTMIDVIRKEKRMTVVDDYQSMEGSGEETSYTGLNEILHEALQQLPEVQRHVILLRDYEGYSYEEIGQITGLSDSQVKVYIYRGRLFLRKYIGKLETVI